ncbi:MAG: DUF2207 domain-containing protein [Gemmatimonadetes bacterium]|nr:DUF2207 domain-containing protein [Gemmatimonadota bacterium]
MSQPHPTGAGRRRVGTLAAALAFAIALAPPAAPPAVARQGARQVSVRRIDAELLVRTDGGLDVTERFEIRFDGSWNGFYRTIPVEYRGPGGLNYSLRVRVLEVTDGAGAPLRYELDRTGRLLRVKVYIPGATDAQRQLVLRYRVQQALRFFADHDELYWNVVGQDSDVPVALASARVLLPVAVSGVRAQAFEGPDGSTEAGGAEIVGGNVVEVRALRPLAPKEGLTVAVGWAPGVVHRPTAAERIWLFLLANWILALPLLAFVIMWRVWFLYGRDPRLRPIVPRYEPPDGLTVAEAGTLLDNGADAKDITAMLVDLAVRGYMRIQEIDAGGLLGLRRRPDYIFHQTRPPAAWAELLPHEQALLRALFDDGSRSAVSMSSLVNSFYRELPAIKDAIFDRLVYRGYYKRRPDAVRKPFVAAGIVLGAAVAYGGSALARHLLGQQPVPFVIAGVATGAIVVLFGLVMPARTLAGTRALEGVLGFREFLRRVEGDRIQRVIKTPEMFERYLPYAMAFGVAKEWARAFEDICREPPRWYAGPPGQPFRASSFTHDLGDMCGRTASAMTSAPKSSSSSGLGGGGSSGGGFGGGGMGGF